MRDALPLKPSAFGLRSVFALMMVALVAAACAVTDADIEGWKTTMRGPGKIVSVLAADKYAMPLRIHAGIALVEMERPDVDGIAELQGAVHGLPVEAQREVVDGMIPRLIELMNSGAPGSAPAPLQVRAKDAAFVVRQYASPEQQANLTSAIVGWFVADFNERSLAGNFSAEQVITALGAPAATRLVEAMRADLPPQALTKIGELIAQLGDAATKQRAAERIVAIEREMETDAYLQNTLLPRVRQQLTEAAGGTAPNEQRALAVAAFNREQFILGGAFPTMHHLAGQPVVAARLLEIGRQPSTTPEATARRVTALQALEGHVDASQIAPLLSIALAAAEPPEVRDVAFDRIGDARDRSVVPQLWPTAVQASSSGPDAWRARWRVGTLLLSLGGPDVLNEWLTRLPRATGEQYAREELHGYAERLSQMRPQPTAQVRTRLTSTVWFEQALALYYFGRVGAEADLPAIQALTTSTVATVGPNWAEHNTIGAIATSTVTAIRERVGAGTPAAPAPAPGR